MLCDNCKPLCATTHKQLENRLLNLLGNLDMTIHPCSKCGGTEWASTDAYVVLQKSRWRRFLDRFYSR